MKINNPNETKSYKQLDEVCKSVNKGFGYKHDKILDFNTMVEEHNKIYNTKLRLIYDPQTFNLIIDEN